MLTAVVGAVVVVVVLDFVLVVSVVASVVVAAASAHVVRCLFWSCSCCYEQIGCCWLLLFVVAAMTHSKHKQNELLHEKPMEKPKTKRYHDK